jgi:uncharacterized protein (TIGR03084 family)
MQPPQAVSDQSINTFDKLLRDLRGEQGDLRSLLDSLQPDDWGRPTPAVGWAVRDQLYHLAHYDMVACEAMEDPASFADRRNRALGDPDAYERAHVTDAQSLPAADLLQLWQTHSRDLLEHLSARQGSDRIEWFGPPMSAASFATARLMEVWAHGEDITEVFGIDRPATDRLRHVAQLGVLTRRWSYRVHGREAPDIPVRLELTGPGGQLWTWGPSDARDSIKGTALDFCLVVTQRRGAPDTGLELHGAAAGDWMQVAQAFAGRPGLGPETRKAFTGSARGQAFVGEARFD